MSDALQRLIDAGNDLHVKAKGLVSNRRPGRCANTTSGPDHNERLERPMAKRPLPSPEVLRQLLSYDPETGKLFWKERGIEWFRAGNTSCNGNCASWNRKYAGKEAFTARKNSGHLHGLIFKRATMAHRVAWAIHYGEHPRGDIDHINHDPADNRIANLRVVDDSENAKNRSPNRGKKSGLPHGVSKRQDATAVRYIAQIQVDGRNRHLGSFSTPEEAHAAYLQAAREHGFHENHAILRAYQQVQQ